MEIINLTPEKGKLENKVFSFGTVKRDSDISLTVSLTNPEEIKHLRTDKQCGCSLPTAVQILPNQIHFSVKYNSNLLGYFDKWVEEIYQINGKEEKYRFNIQGTVIQ